jgi:hypothetical protein
VTERQLDLFAPEEPPETPAPVWRPPARPAPAELSDAELVAALPGERLQESVALAAEAGRRRLASAVPALALLCRRFVGWGSAAPVAQQVAALAAMVEIGGAPAAGAVATGIARAEFIGATLVEAVSAAAALDAALPEETLLGFLRQDDAKLREAACRCARLTPEIVAGLIELLDDLHPAVMREAACALGRLGRAEGRATLRRLLENEPSPAIVAALGRIADEDCLVLLARLARRVPALADAVIDALEASEHPRAAALLESLQSL